jgi:hypothetical protein
MTFLKKITLFTLPFLLIACGEDDTDTSGLQTPITYEFISLTDPSAPSSVDYKVATTQLTLIKELEYLIGSDELQAYGQANDRDAVIVLLNRVYEGGTHTSFSNNLAMVNLYDDTSTPTTIKGINLGDGTLNFAADSLSENTNIKSTVSAEMNVQIQDWFFNIATLAADFNKDTRFTNNGFNFKALVVGNLSVTMPFQQVSNTFLSASNLAADNTRNDSSSSYTQLEHNWDLSFGYFGSSKLAKTLSLDKVISINTNKTNNVSSLDDFVFDVAAATAQRDFDSTLRESNFSKAIIEGFLNGRTSITLNESHKLYSKQTSLINQYASAILYNWEKSLAATLIYHTKNTIINRYKTNDYDYHWAMMTVYAQAIASYKNSLLPPETITLLTNDKLSTEDINKQTIYLETLFEAEQTIKTTYGFSRSDVSSWR